MAEIVRKARADLFPALERGDIRPVPIDRTFALDEVRAAVERMTRNEHFGKIAMLP